MIRARSLVTAACVLGGASGAGAAVAIPASAPAAPRPAVAPAARAAAPASIRVNHACYQTAQRAALSGTGFDPSSRWTATLDGAAFGRGTTTAAGGIVATFGVPSHLLAGSTGEDSYSLVVREGKHVASATFLVTKLSASFSPTSATDLSTLRVRFRLLGWGRGGSVYLHYLNPKGVLRENRYLGPAEGACGHLSTLPEKLFPFTPKVGVWMLQFDKVRGYKTGSVPRAVLQFRVS